MNKKISFGTMAIAALAAFSMSSCDKSKAQVDEKPAAEQPAATRDKDSIRRGGQHHVSV